jgi:hypothetical protein
MRNQIGVQPGTSLSHRIGVAAFVSIAFTLFSPAKGDIEESDFFVVKVRIEHPAGSGPLVNEDAEIRLNPSAQDPNDFGSAVKYTENDSLKFNCHGQKYDHLVVNIADNRTAQVTIGNVTYTVNKSHNEAYWDW